MWRLFSASTIRQSKSSPSTDPWSACIIRTRIRCVSMSQGPGSWWFANIQGFRILGIMHGWARVLYLCNFRIKYCAQFTHTSNTAFHNSDIYVSSIAMPSSILSCYASWFFSFAINILVHISVSCSVLPSTSLYEPSWESNFVLDIFSLNIATPILMFGRVMFSGVSAESEFIIISRGVFPSA